MARKHTAGSDKAAIGQIIVERKIKPDGTVREYECTLLYQRGGLAVIQYITKGAATGFVTPVPVPPGSRSLGFFWLRRPYNLYRMRSPAGELLVHRFDAVTAVRFEPGAITYRDLELDWWVLPDDTVIEEDREDYEALVAKGVFGAKERVAAELATRHIYSRYRHIIDEAAAIEARL